MWRRPSTGLRDSGPADSPPPLIQSIPWEIEKMRDRDPALFLVLVPRIPLV